MGSWKKRHLAFLSRRGLLDSISADPTGTWVIATIQISSTFALPERHAEELGLGP